MFKMLYEYMYHEHVMPFIVNFLCLYFLIWIYKIINVIYLESNILFLRMLALVVFGNYFKIEKTKKDEIDKTI